MSYRPTISIYVNEEIADYGYYRNWKDADLFYEAVAYAVLFHDCKSKEEYRERVYHTQKVSYILEPENFENTQENLHFLEQHSEFPVIVDLTLQNIYVNYGALHQKDLSLIHTFDVPYSYEEFLLLYRFRQQHESEYCCMPKYSEEYLKHRYNSFLRASEKVGTRMSFGTLLGYYRIPFNNLDFDQILTMYRSSNGLKGHCSKQICDLLETAA